MKQYLVRIMYTPRSSGDRFPFVWRVSDPDQPNYTLCTARERSLRKARRAAERKAKAMSNKDRKLAEFKTEQYLYPVPTHVTTGGS